MKRLLFLKHFHHVLRDGDHGPAPFRALVVTTLPPPKHLLLCAACLVYCFHRSQNDSKSIGAASTPQNRILYLESRQRDNTCSRDRVGRQEVVVFQSCIPVNTCVSSSCCDIFIILYMMVKAELDYWIDRLGSYLACAPPQKRRAGG